MVPEEVQDFVELGGEIEPVLRVRVERRSGALDNRQAWQQIVHEGALKDNGMASFKGSLTPEEIEAIRAYVIKRANEDRDMENSLAENRVARR